MALAPRNNRYYSGPISDHFDGLRFFNPDGETPSGFGDVLKWKLQGDRQLWPADLPAPQRHIPASSVADMTITMIGHASLLIQTAGMNLLVDPVLSLRASPLRFAGPKRVIAPGIALDDLPPIHAILISHNHYDHLDLVTLAALQAKFKAPILTPLGNDAIIRSAISDADIRTADWGQSLQIGALTVHFEPCHHWSARGMNDRSMALWAAFVIAGPAGKILHIGDTGFDKGRPYRPLPARHGAIRAAILPIGAYEPRWFMRAQHQNPAEAVEGFRLCGAAYAIGHHWGTFQLTDEAREAPLRDLATALAAQNITAKRFRALAPAEAWAIPAL